MTRAAMPFISILLLSCTSVGPDYNAPETTLPDQWHEGKDSAFLAEPADLAEWWRRLKDPALDGLVERAARQGLDLREALARVREARALRGVAAAERLPSLDAVASYARRGSSENTPLGDFAVDADYYAAGFDSSWEIDLWGRVRRSIEAADADLEATIEGQRDVWVTIAAETAVNYINLRSFQKRLEIALTNVALQEQTLELVRARFESGLVGERDVAQARSNVATTRSRVPDFEVGVRVAEHQLAVLLGLVPGALADELAKIQPIPVPPLELAVGVPANLLRRRADVRQAERLLAAETARIGVAKGDQYPRLSLMGNLGVEADEAPDLFESGSRVFGIGPSLRWNLFDGGRLREKVEAQDARAEQAWIRWERTVLIALEESENAMTAFVREQTRRSSLLEAAAQARRAVELAQTQYTEGLSDFQAVLISERAVAELEDQLAQSDTAIATNFVLLYKALGGGWEHGPWPMEAPGTTSSSR